MGGRGGAEKGMGCLNDNFIDSNYIPGSVHMSIPLSLPQWSHQGQDLL